MLPFCVKVHQQARQVGGIVQRRRRQLQALDENSATGMVKARHHTTSLLGGVVNDLTVGTPECDLIAGVVLQERSFILVACPSPSRLDPFRQSEVAIGKKNSIEVTKKIDQIVPSLDNEAEPEAESVVFHCGTTE